MDRLPGGRKQKFGIRGIIDLKEVRMRQEDAEKLVKKGEKLGAQGFVKTYGFEHSMVFLMQFAKAFCKTVSEHKSFRMELIYDAEALNTDYVFFIPTES